MNIIPITDKQAILVRFQCTALLDLKKREILWAIICPALEAALDQKRNMLALGSKGMVHLWDLRSGSHKQTLRLSDDNDIPTALAFHPQGSFLAIAPYYDAVQIWQIADGQLVHRLVLEEESYAAYQSIAFSPDGQFLATGNFEAGEVWLWHVPDGQLIQQMESPVDRVEGLAFSPDGQFLVCGDAGGNGTEIRVWDVHTKHVIHGFPRKGWHPAFSLDGKLLASTSADPFVAASPSQYSDWRQPIIIWDVATRSEIRRFPTHMGRISRLTFSPSGRLLVSIGDQKPTIRWWEVESGREVYRIGEVFRFSDWFGGQGL